MTGRFKDKVVIVTGGGRGMGRAIADAFHAEGARLMIAVRTLSYGEDAVAQYRAAGGEAEVCQVDVLRPADLTRLIDETVARFGGIDVLVHNAAEVPHGSVLAINDDDMTLALDGSVRALVRLLQAAHPHLKVARDGGRVVAIGSLAGTRTVIPNMAMYGVSKSALAALVRSAAFELANDKITVNTVDPGLTASDRVKELVDPEREARALREVPIGRMGQPSEIARAVLFLADGDAGFITGQAVPVDGGATLCSFKAGS